MAYLNDNYLKLKAGYLFPEIGRRVKAFSEANPEAARRLIRCGIGDVTEPLPARSRERHAQGGGRDGARETFRGYGPSRATNRCATPSRKTNSVAEGLDVADDEIFVSRRFEVRLRKHSRHPRRSNRIAITDPVYPVYVDTNVMAGHTGPGDEAARYGGLVYLP